METRPNLPVLTSLRFFAASVVVVGHFGPDRLFGSTPLREWFSSGYEAVSFFFMLSGFILVYVYARVASPVMYASDRRFWAARFARIMPAYTAALLISLPQFAHLNSTRKFLSGLILVPMLLQAWVPTAALLWNFPAWSLSVEAFFYALFPRLLQWTARHPQWLVLVVTYIFTLLTDCRWLFKGDADFGTAWFSFLSYFPLFHLPTFIFGMALGLSYLHRKARSGSGLMLATGLIGLSVVLGIKTGPMINGVLAPLFGLVIFGGAGVTGRALNVLSTRPLLLLGESSYAMYILHWPLKLWWDDVSSKLDLPSAIDFVGYFMLVTTASVLMFLYGEKVVRRHILAYLDKSRYMNTEVRRSKSN